MRRTSINAPRSFGRGNFSYDLAGGVDLTDFTILAANFNKHLAPPAAPAPAAAVAPNAPAAAAAPSSPFSSQQVLRNRLTDELL